MNVRIRLVLLLATLVLPACERSAPNADADASATPTGGTNQPPAMTGTPSAVSGAPAASPSADNADATDPFGLPPGHPPLTPPPAEPPAASTQVELPPGHPPLSPQQPMTAERVLPAPPKTGADALQFEPPADWQPQPSGSAFRVAQFTLPASETGEADGDMILYYFGPGQGGTVEANIARWRGMFKTPEGEPLPDSAVRIERRDVNGLQVTILDAAGVYAPSAMMPGQDPGAPRPGYRMLAAVVVGPDGDRWFWRGVGPTATMAEHLDAFEQMLSTLRLAKP